MTQKRFFSILLSLVTALALLAGFTPLTALHALAADAGFTLWIDGNLYADDASGDGWSFDLETRTLTLTNFNYSGEGYVFGYSGSKKSAIYFGDNAQGDRKACTIKLSGDNSVTQTGGAGALCCYYGIYSNAPLRVTGSGKLTAAVGETDGMNAGIYCDESSSLTVDGGATVTAKGGKAGKNSYGILCNEGSLTVDGGATVTAKGGAAENDASKGIDCKGMTVDGGAKVTAEGNKDSKESIGVGYGGLVRVTGSGVLTATGGDATWNSFGLNIDTLTVEQGAEVKAEAGNAGNCSYGVYIATQIKVDDAKLTAASGEAQLDSSGITTVTDTEMLVSGANAAVNATAGNGPKSFGIAAQSCEFKLTIENCANVTAAGNTQAFNDQVKNAVKGMGFENADGSGAQTRIAANGDWATLAYKRIEFPYYDVTLNANDGAQTPATQALYKPHGAIVTLPGDAFSRTGYAFSKWSTGADGSGEAYAAGEGVTLADDLSLFAQWTANMFTVDAIPDETYTGGAITPAITVRDAADAAKVLVKDADYTVAYSNNVDVGTAKVTVTGTGDYCAATGDGWTDPTFAIVNATLTDVSVTQDGVLTYSGEAQKPLVTTAATAVNSQPVTFTYGRTQNGTYGDMPTVTNVSDSGTFYYKASAPNHNDITGSFTVTVNRGTAPAVVVPALNAVTYDPAKTLASIELPGGWAWVTATDVPTVVNGGYGAALTVDDANYDYTVVEGYDATTHKVVRTVALTVNKANAVAATVTANNRTYDGTEKPLVTVTGTATGGTMQYAPGTDDRTAPTTGYTASIPTATDAGTYYVWYKAVGDKNHNDSKPASVKAAIEKAAPSITAPTARTLTYTGSAQALVTAGTATGGTMQYAIGDADGATQPYTASIPTATDAGTYYVWYKAVGDINHNDSKPASVKAAIEKAAPSITAPTARTLTYTGSAQALVTAGTATGGTMQYAIGDADGATQPYTTSIPTATEAGTYYVWYKAVGDDNHTDTEPDKVEVKISPADRAALNEAIAEAETCYNSIRDDYAEIAATLKTAIETAKKVAENENIPESEIVAAISALNGAVDTAKGGVKKAADEAAANSVIALINALPESAGVGDKDAVNAARAAYDKLTDDQKALIPADVLARLTAAEDQVQAAEAEASKIDIAECKITVKDLTYTGKAVTAKAMKAAVTVKYGKQTLEYGTDYSLTYDKALKDVGPAAVTVEGKGNYKGSKEADFNIIPKGTAFTKLTGGQQQITLKWKNPGNITGYQIEYSLKKDFKASEKVRIDEAKTLTATIEKLAAGKTYYVRIRTYKTVSKKNYYSAWSKADTVKTVAEQVDISKCTITVENLTYTGKAVTAKAMKAAVTVKYGKQILEYGTDYSLTYDKALKAIGPATVTVEGMGKYKGSKEVDFNIIPKGTAFTKLTGGAQQITLKWKNPGNITGYQIEYSLKKDFKTSEKVRIGKAGTLTATIKKLADGKTYYVRIRTYKTVSKKGYYSAWSKADTVSTAARQVDISKCKITVKDLTYTGKAVTAKAMKKAVTVKYGKQILEYGTDYSLTYDKALKAVGPATVTVVGKGNYTGSRKVTFNIVPKGTAFTSLTGGKQSITLKWKKQANITGYQIQYSLKKDFKGAGKANIPKAKTLKTTIGDLKAKTTYYVRIRTYRTVGKENYYSAWSKAETVVTASGKATNEADVQPIEVDMNADEALDLKPLLPGEVSDYGQTWESSDTEIATVSQDGVASALQAGAVIVTMTNGDGEKVAFAVNVSEAETLLLVLSDIEPLPVGDVALPGEMEIGMAE